LLDFKSWADRHEIIYHPTSRYSISISQLEQVATEQNVQFRVGDILIVRTGFVNWHNGASDDDLKKGTRDGSGTYIGVEAGEESAAWFWNHRFSMVACDTMAFEAWPPSGRLFSTQYEGIKSTDIIYS
jgi:hypothetical protein